MNLLRTPPALDNLDEMRAEIETAAGAMQRAAGIALVAFGLISIVALVALARTAGVKS